MLLDYLVDFCDKQYSVSKPCRCGNKCNKHPSGVCSGSCYDCLYQIHFPRRFYGEKIKKEYDCTKMLYHYVCQYSYLYTTEMLYALCEELNFINKFPYYHVLSLGCGGCADLMAFDCLLSHQKITAPISYLGIEINPLWKPIHDEIEKYYNSSDAVKFRIPGYNDAFDCFKDKELPNTNIIIISYLISYSYNTGQINKIDELAKDIANNIISKKSGNETLLLIINDVNSNNRGRDYFSHFEEAIKNSGITIINGKYKYFDTGNLNCYQTNGFLPYNATKCLFGIPPRIEKQYHAQKKLNSTIQLLLEVK